MRVTGNSGAWPSPYSTSKGRRTESGPGWEQYLDPEVQKRKMAALPEKGSLGSVFMQFEDDYKAWKAQQPELALPDSQGWTEENLAFLRERYAGDLSAFEIYDALDTMKQLGILSEKGLRCAEGTTLIAIEMKAGIVETSADPDSKAAWLHGFDEAPMVGFRSLEGILSWAKDFREEDHPDFITGAEAMARGWI